MTEEQTTEEQEVTTPEAVAEEAVEKEEKVAKKKPAASAAKKSASLGKDEMIEAIKQMTVLELAELVKALEEEFGVSAAVPMAVAAPAGGVAEEASPTEEQTEFSVVLTGFGESKINVIKAVREVTSLGLKEAKELVESAPKPIKEAVAKDEATTIKEKLEAVGATVEIK